MAEDALAKLEAKIAALNDRLLALEARQGQLSDDEAKELALSMRKFVATFFRQQIEGRLVALEAPRRKVRSKTVVTKHDDMGRILEFEKEEIP